MFVLKLISWLWAHIVHLLQFSCLEENCTLGENDFGCIQNAK